MGTFSGHCSGHHTHAHISFSCIFDTFSYKSYTKKLFSSPKSQIQAVFSLIQYVLYADRAKKKNAPNVMCLRHHRELANPVYLICVYVLCVCNNHLAENLCNPCENNSKSRVLLVLKCVHFARKHWFILVFWWAFKHTPHAKTQSSYTGTHIFTFQHHIIIDCCCCWCHYV